MPGGVHFSSGNYGTAPWYMLVLTGVTIIALGGVGMAAGVPDHLAARPGLPTAPARGAAANRQHAGYALAAPRANWA